ncbi:MAG: 4-hydroxy-tetrahydrodipicolinate synthase [Rhodospirillaceae bacterium]|jgi:4-hydroxy-tetrahydrodipicolinate synthase|nr:4-hydroxy-tetrahydrodipicolinate synthase [Rhodospirillaceae bacterium]MBT5245400.1 4-hydroxy-tetrahydrodipicolinate synthase [Rhodospirillaceae bacterium]MBT5562556.1 4-hydroxy-tetrahydrodipicolinate synthase [Rhodospirillaceae bacterium]MBT6242586.1 4-hydroxy-tetrahydrodipicolinate synthase [Rhodospirillaceae bacterium]MBT7137235.1 4-hydroxy-tetrahydrodipicolinate synthase [Rhodospirillaceae bacterium]
MFQGSMPALMTPMANGKVDTAAFKKLVDWQIQEGSNGLVPCGTTGESPTLSHEEHMHVTELCIEVAAGRVPVIAGAGSNSTDEAIMLAVHAKKAGADAALVVMPYYNKPTPEGQYQHFKAVHDACELPIIIYNIPGRSVVDMTMETMARLAELPNIVGVKDATGDLVRPIQTRNTLGEGFCQLSGEDATALAHLIGGGVGCISVSANVAPRLCSDMQRAWREGDLKTAMELQFRLMPLHDAMFCESSPGPVKYAGELLGLCSSEARLPICEISEPHKKQVKDALVHVGLLN